MQELWHCTPLALSLHSEKVAGLQGLSVEFACSPGVCVDSLHVHANEANRQL